MGTQTGETKPCFTALDTLMQVGADLYIVKERMTPPNCSNDRKYVHLAIGNPERTVKSPENFQNQSKVYSSII